MLFSSGGCPAEGDARTTYCYEEGRPHLLSGTSTTADCDDPGKTYVYEASGHTTSRPGPTAQQYLKWTSESRLSRPTEDGKDTDYVYDADGSLLIKTAENGDRRRRRCTRGCRRLRAPQQRDDERLEGPQGLALIEWMSGVGSRGRSHGPREPSRPSEGTETEG